MLKKICPETGRFAASFALMLFMTSTVKAQQTQPDSLLSQADLPSVIGYALKQQPRIQQAKMDETITSLQVKSRLADWYPQLNFNYNYQHNFQVQTNIIGGNPVRLGVDNISNLQFTLNQALFNRDVLLAKRTGADVRTQARQQTENTRIDLVAGVSKAFFDVLATAQQVKVAEENIARLKRSLNDARAAYDAGIADKTDYKRASIALNNAIASQKTFSEMVLAKTSYLKALMNYPQEGYLPLASDSMQLEKNIYLDTLATPDYNNRIEYKLLSTQLRLQEANLKYNKWSYIPNVSANAAYNLNYLNNDFSKLYSQNFPNSYAGITLSFPIFQGGKRKYNVQTAEWQVKRTELDMALLRNSINSEYQAALASYKANYASYLALKENMEMAKEVYEVINLQYRAGVKTYLEVVTAESDLRTAQINYFNSLFQVLSSRIDVQRSLGVLEMQ